jgi:hypothetical protein
MDKFKKQYPTYENKNVTVDDCEHFENKADFVEVVRCKDCNHWNNGYCEGIPFCGDYASYIETKETDFCSYGERKEDE